MNKIKSLITQFINAMQKRPGLLAVLVVLLWYCKLRAC
ncbi:hypothetical protein P20480_2625 [Pseudoalteromonas sp. BSi20480]|nr:hypothetical protein P20480_2625 [Pseudoalteromonas sp. BSi20480]